MMVIFMLSQLRWGPLSQVQPVSILEPEETV
ncbi:hypothetical protein QO002_004506 [Pararhizobium capsulatum DSM 1112]|uniref:Uncharacterized protein n=1 Tax=Pararhizobium capsulatum DSM 1112 TaxID=1121113 RepID=A0ABU0BVL7_9HYPH|nr:hypothetical protein [Pararhizobium capsulatum DSM 1112]